MNEQEREKMLELLSDKAVFGLTDEEFAEFAELEKNFPEFQDESFELAAATIGMMNLDTSEPMPAHLRTKIASDAEQFFASQKKAVSISEPQKEPEEFQKTFAFEPKKSIWSWLGWAVAGFACVALAINIWTTRLNQTAIVKNTPTPSATPKLELTPAQEREQFLASAKDIIKTSWTEPNPKTAKQISGEVVWSNSEQKGFVTFRGLPANNSSQETYQLWIVDETRDKYPVDGGIFDVNGNGEIVIPLAAKLKITNPKMFAVTKEKPGGVVVSSLGEKLVAVAKVSA